MRLGFGALALVVGIAIFGLSLIVLHENFFGDSKFLRGQVLGLGVVMLLGGILPFILGILLLRRRNG
jgi:hypothetical protein